MRPFLRNKPPDMQAAGSSRAAVMPTGRSVERKRGQCRTQAAQRFCVAAGSLFGLFDQRDEGNDAEAAAQPLEAPQRLLPCGLVPRARQKIDLPVRAFEKRAAQIVDQHRIVSDRRRQGRVQIAAFIGHVADNTGRKVNDVLQNHVCGYAKAAAQ